MAKKTQSMGSDTVRGWLGASDPRQEPAIDTVGQGSTPVVSPAPVQAVNPSVGMPAVTAKSQEPVLEPVASVKRKKTTSFTIDPDVLESFKRIVAFERVTNPDISISMIIEDMITQYVNEHADTVNRMEAMLRK